ncbi:MULTISPECIES: hypothetical protein [unclassified Nocardioides]|uniref:hypothetical protein n=1 Tax=unclassified Nocardioides TaxID=2615069 RepID=UPI0000571BC9|nr:MULTISPECIES: hypothetical protein [unclassified Nocardioides]ABL79700.1 hypothetical protein Noca_0155 [Nocardioides sp. JS614]
MTRALILRRGAVAVGLALMASLSACGGDDGGGSGAKAPDDASTDDFCATFNSLFEKVLSQATSGDSAAVISALKDWAADIEDVGTPSAMPDDARHGFELFVDQAKKLDENASLEDLQNLGDDLSADDQADGEAFTTWTEENCPLDIPGLDGSDLPSIDPSDLPSIDPSDLASMDPEELESMMSELASNMSELTESP